MFILMKYSKMEGTRTRMTAHRVGLFRTRRGANKVMARLVEQEKKKPVPASFKVEHECYYSTRAFWEAVANAYWNWQDRRYTKLVNKFNRLQRKLDDMRRARG